MRPSTSSNTDTNAELDAIGEPKEQDKTVSSQAIAPVINYTADKILAVQKLIRMIMRMQLPKHSQTMRKPPAPLYPHTLQIQALLKYLRQMKMVFSIL